MTLRPPRLLACFLSLLCAGFALAADPPATNSHFQITQSFPVNEATWAEKVGALYLIAAQRSVLVYRKTGPGEADYQEVNRLFPGLDAAWQLRLCYFVMLLERTLPAASKT